MKFYEFSSIKRIQTYGTLPTFSMRWPRAVQTTRNRHQPYSLESNGEITSGRICMSCCTSHAFQIAIKVDLKRTASAMQQLECVFQDNNLHISLWQITYGMARIPWRSAVTALCEWCVCMCGSVYECVCARGWAAWCDKSEQRSCCSAPGNTQIHLFDEWIIEFFNDKIKFFPRRCNDEHNAKSFASS